MVSVIDYMAGLYLLSGNWHGFATCCLVGISFLNVSGSFVEVSMGALASLILARFVNGMLKHMKSTPSEMSLEDGAEVAATP
jgi:hypothetical protein